MNPVSPSDWDELSILELFRIEVETQSNTLTNGLLDIEKHAASGERLTELMRAAHSLKGAARIASRAPAIQVAHAIEECFVGAQTGKLKLSRRVVDALLGGVDLLQQISRVPEEDFQNWHVAHCKHIQTFTESLTALLKVVDEADLPAAVEPEFAPTTVSAMFPSAESMVEKAESGERLTVDRALRVTAGNLNSLMGLAGEALLATRWLNGFGNELSRLKHSHKQLGHAYERLRESLSTTPLEARQTEKLTGLRADIAACQGMLAECLADLERFDRRSVSFSTRLYYEVLDCRMRPFNDGIQGLQRMVRDVSRTLGRSVQLDIHGETTLVDADILERLNASLNHLLRNAIDHGIEPPEERRQRGKHEVGKLRLEAVHTAGLLLITICDDGRGVDISAVKSTILRRRLATAEMVERMSENELLQFLFVPGFTLRESVSEISGRGVGLDVVHSMATEVGGRVRVSSELGQGTCFHLELPLTLSTARTLLIEVAGEPYALPLARIEKAVRLRREEIHFVQGRPHFKFQERHVGLVTAQEALGLPGSLSPQMEINVIVLGDTTDAYGLVVDRFLGEEELVVRPLDPRLGKVKNISSAALMPDGSPVLILDMDDLKGSIGEIVAGRSPVPYMRTEDGEAITVRQKRVLVVDDSLTVRELERKLLASKGYTVDIALDGMDGWNAMRTGQYHLLITDVDMPRMDGIELVKLVRQDSRLKATPVIVVSYKDRVEDRNRGLEAGAEYYLTKASFHDETLLRVVADLIGEASA